MNERFTDLADFVSEQMGRWYVMAGFLLLVAVWLLDGPFAHFSDTWQLVMNTATTIITTGLCLLIAASANRTERRNRELHEILLRIVQTDDQKLDRVIGDVESHVAREG